CYRDWSSDVCSSDLRITAAAGRHAATISPDDRWIADVYSYTNKPPELYVQEARAQAESRKLTSSPAPDFAAYPWQDAPIIAFKEIGRASCRKERALQ